MNQGVVFKATKIIIKKNINATLNVPSWWGGDDVIVCVSGIHTNPNTKMQRAVFILSTLGPGFRKVYFRAPDPPDPSGRSAQTHKTYVVSPKHWLHVDGADKCGSSVQSLY